MILIKWKGTVHIVPYLSELSLHLLALLLLYYTLLMSCFYACIQNYGHFRFFLLTRNISILKVVDIG